MLAHELRNPLGPIRIATQVMTSADATSTAR
jgi:nitrogen-specific signal transduction histidine kinase